mmetsp:Transcript_67829/g.126713  ORF Transcript_67829/g.126713 Transcript_67829/m.126713 type:complete len:86 (+) Transcript_67829:213-470(+)
MVGIARMLTNATRPNPAARDGTRIVSTRSAATWRVKQPLRYASTTSIGSRNLTAVNPHRVGMTIRRAAMATRQFGSTELHHARKL